jgi:hypothetical protein
MRANFIIQGQTQYNGTPEAGGPSYDQTKLLANIPFSRQQKDSKIGNDTQPLLFGDHKNYQKLLRTFEDGNTYLEIECEFEYTQKGIEVLEIFKVTPMELVVKAKKTN